MRGDWLTSLARRLTRPGTFERLVSPAIADLQSEASGNFLIGARHYIAIWAVLVCALWRDFGLEIRTALDADALHHVWRRAAIWYLGYGRRPSRPCTLVMGRRHVRYDPRGGRRHALAPPV